MKRKVLMTIFAILIIAGIAIVFSYVNFLVKEKRYNDKVKVTLNNNYDKFKENVKHFSDVREELLKETSNIYLEDLAKSYTDITDVLEDYDKAIAKVKESADPVSKLSKNIRGTDKELQNKISAFKINYEQTINYYVGDYKGLNEKIKLYNEYIEENSPKAKPLKLLVASIKDYIDFDGNGVQLGVE